MTLNLGLDVSSCYIEIIHSCQKYHKNNTVPFSGHHIKGFMMLICVIPGDVYLDHLVKRVSAGLPHSKVTLSFCSS